MNAIQMAKASIQNLACLMRGTSTARTNFNVKRLPPAPAPRATKIYVIGNMVQVRDQDTDRVLGWRESYLEAEQLGRDLVAGKPNAVTTMGGAA